MAEKIVNLTVMERCTGEGDFEKFVKKIERILTECPGDPVRCHQAYLVGLTRAAEVARTFTEGRQCSPANTGHDDRWCGVCETVKDTADVIAAAIEKLKENTK